MQAIGPWGLPGICTSNSPKCLDPGGNPHHHLSFRASRAPWTSWYGYPPRHDSSLFHSLFRFQFRRRYFYCAFLGKCSPTFRAAGGRPCLSKGLKGRKYCTASSAAACAACAASWPPDLFFSTFYFPTRLTLQSRPRWNLPWPCLPPYLYNVNSITRFSGRHLPNPYQRIMPGGLPPVLVTNTETITEVAHPDNVNVEDVAKLWKGMGCH